jgi:hypothetical protein
MIALLAGMLLVGVASGCFTALLRPRGTIAVALSFAVVAFAEVVVVSHGLSFFDAYERRWFLVTTAALALVAALAVALRRPRPPSFQVGAIRDLLGDRLVAVLAALVVVELAYLLALGLFTPPTEYDALTYHLTRAVLWIQAESVRPVAGVTDFRINEFPPNAEILQGWTMLLSSSVRWVALVQLGALLVTMAAIYGIALRIGLDRRQGAFGALLFPTLPVVALQAPTALNDLVVAALVATAVFFALGQHRADIGLACLATAMLAGTKVTVVFAVPVLLAIALLAQRGRYLVAALAGGAASLVIGGSWYIAHRDETGGEFGAYSNQTGLGDGAATMTARATRYAGEWFELPGAPGKDALLYVAVAALVAVVGIGAARGRTALVSAALVALPVALIVVEDGLRRAYFKGWSALGYDNAAAYGIIRDATLASNLQSWYGPVGLALTVGASVLTIRGAARRTLPWVAVACAVAPIVFLIEAALTTGYNPFAGRYVMGGVALSAATWGLVRRLPAVAAAVVAVAAVTSALSLLNYHEKPTGIDLLTGTHRPSIWHLPREWAQSVQPEVAKVIGHVDDRAAEGTTIALTRDEAVYPFAYVGYPGIEHRILYADSLAEATRRRADWAVLPLDVECAPDWKLDFRSPPWGVYRQVPGVSCR